VILNRREKEQLVIKLHQEGKTIREIASAAHLSFGVIGTIIRRSDGHDKDSDIETKDLKNKSKDTQALFLFSKGKKPIEVAIELNLSASEVQNLLEEFWALNELHELAFVYNEIKTFLPSFLKLFHCLKKTKC
jgi:transposase